MLIIVGIILVLLAIWFVVWCLKNMSSKSCPVCYEDDMDEIIIPVIPGFRWWCPVCNEFFRSDELHEKTEADKNKPQKPSISG